MLVTISTQLTGYQVPWLRRVVGKRTKSTFILGESCLWSLPMGGSLAAAGTFWTLRPNFMMTADGVFYAQGSASLFAYQSIGNYTPLGRVIRMK